MSLGPGSRHRDNDSVVYALDWNQFVQVAEIPARIVFLLLLGFLTRLIVHRMIDRLVAKASGLTPPRQIFGSQRAAQLIGTNATLYSERRERRAHALGSLFKSVTTAATGAIVVLMILDQLGFPLGPILASAGIVGVAVGLGAQHVVRDFIAGVCMLLEDQYGVGDVIDTGHTVGTVESVGLRVTRVRGPDGALWHIRNGEIARIANRSQGWSGVSVDLAIAYDENLTRVERLVDKIVGELVDTDEWRDRIVERPRLLGIERVGDEAITLRIAGRCVPEHQGALERELRQRIKAGFDAENVRLVSLTMPE